MPLAIRTLPADSDDAALKALVVEWSGLLAQGRYAEALGMFANAGKRSVSTPELLERTIAGYGVPEPHPDGVRFAITPLLGRSDAEEIIRDKIQVDREHLYGLDPARYSGMVHYHDVPLNGARSDLTARFNILRVGKDHLTLEFKDIHVM